MKPPYRRPDPSIAFSRLARFAALYDSLTPEEQSALDCKLERWCETIKNGRKIIFSRTMAIELLMALMEFGGRAIVARSIDDVIEALRED